MNAFCIIDGVEDLVVFFFYLAILLFNDYLLFLYFLPAAVKNEREPEDQDPDNGNGPGNDPGLFLFLFVFEVAF
ncbi:hypothetical protein D3C86_1681110 [compost metagenome]